ncbi:hypothetical protein [Flavobacterium terrae]|uniref:Uncharacterized protein n=1 Tax=Flavobacterium terrae TaxID=415425 RepID=A0A1M6EXJ2_9FLAO|nr:hypothetical protein [Flavobacterium terrae]SHI90091.1 hypothetical protein SAMN05444363_2011 [Flavobacterium terrae]
MKVLTFEKRNSMKKVILFILMLIVVGVLFWQLNSEQPNIWVQVMGFVLLFYGMMRLSRKVPSKNQEQDEE